MAPPPEPLRGVRAVLFDIDDTLFPSSEFAALARRHAIRAMIEAGLRTTEPRAAAELARIVEAKGPNFTAHYDLLSRRFPCADRYHVIAAGVAAYHNTKSSIEPYPHAMRTLLELRERGYPLFVASEGLAVKQWDKLIRLGLDQLFERVFVTQTAGVGKEAAFYRRIARQLRLPPASILMVGDNPDKDIAPAQEAGLRTARVRTGRRARRPSEADVTLADLGGLLPRLPPPRPGAGA